jgi:hypothetical protein
MLTASQCIVAAYMTDGDVICPDCARTRLNFDGNQVLADLREEAEEKKGSPLSWSEDRDLEQNVNDQERDAEEAAGLQPLIQYDLDSDETFQADGLTCGDCGCELVEPDPQENDEEEQTDEAKELETWDEQGDTEDDNPCPSGPRAE